jgi:hypothetical protein
MRVESQQHRWGGDPCRRHRKHRARVGQGVSLTNGTLYRVEFDITGIGAGAAAGDSSVYCYLGNTNTQVGSTDTVTGVNFGSVAYDTVSFGVNAGGVVSASMWLDGFSLNANRRAARPEPASRVPDPDGHRGPHTYRYGHARAVLGISLLYGEIHIHRSVRREHYPVLQHRCVPERC